MNRRNFIKNLGIGTTGIFMLPEILLWKKDSGPFHELRNGVGYFTGRGGTIGWYAKGDALVVVDSQFEDTAIGFVSGINQFGSGNTKVLFNTHHHGDHVGGNQIFKDDNYRIIAHENVPELHLLAASAQGNESPTVAQITFEKEFAIDAEGEHIRAKYYGNAHTAGDSVIWFEEANIAHMGDLVFNRVYPFIDRTGGAKVTGWISLLETVASQADNDTVFIFGHGNPENGVIGSKQDVLAGRNYLSHLLGYVTKGINDGKSVDELTTIEQFDEFPNHISFGARLSLRANIETTFLELTEG